MPVQVSVVRGPLSAATASAVRALVERGAAQDGVAPIGEQPLLWLTDPQAQVAHVLAHEIGPDEQLVGYAQVDVGLDAQATAELTVDPAARRHGLGTRLLAEACAVAATVHGRPLHVWAHGDLPAARALTGAAGGVVTRELLCMRADLGKPRDPRPLPPGVTLRTFHPGHDEDAWRRVNARAFAHHPEQGRISDADLRAREREPWFDAAGFLLAERDAVLLGFVWTKVHPAGAHGPDEVGEIYVVGVDPDAQGLGLGGALTCAAMDHLASRGLTEVILYTDADNAVAVHTYERLGFAVAAVDLMLTMDTDGSSTNDTMDA